jgi:hypothetical protein
MALPKELIKELIAKLADIQTAIEELDTCSKCGRPAAARGLCSKHYNQWRRDYCRERQIKNLRDQPEVVEPDPRQAQLFSDVLEKFEF